MYNNAPVILTASVLGGKQAAVVAISVYILNFIYSVPANFYKRLRLAELHLAVERSEKQFNYQIVKELLYSGIAGLCLSACLTPIVHIVHRWHVFGSDLVNVSFLMPLLIWALPFRFMNIFLGAVLLNKKFVSLRISAQFCAASILCVSLLISLRSEDWSAISAAILIGEAVLFLLYGIALLVNKNE